MRALAESALVDEAAASRHRALYLEPSPHSSLRSDRDRRTRRPTSAASRSGRPQDDERDSNVLDYRRRDHEEVEDLVVAEDGGRGIRPAEHVSECAESVEASASKHEHGDRPSR